MEKLRSNRRKNNGDSENVQQNILPVIRFLKTGNLPENRGAGHFPGHTLPQTGIPEAIVCGGAKGEENGAIIIGMP